MNCQEFALVLDDGDVEQLNGQRRQDAEAHLAGCPACRLEQQIQLRLAQVVAPPLPPGLAARCQKRVGLLQMRVAPQAQAAAPRRRNRGVIAGAALAIASAAAVVFLQGNGPSVAVVSVPAAVSQPHESDALPANSLENVAEVPAADSMESVAEVEQALGKPVAEVAPILVLLSPPDVKGLDATSALILDQFHVVIARRLATIPGVTLLLPDALPATGRYYRILMRISGSRADGARSVSLTTALVRDGKLDSAMGSDLLVDPAADIAQVASAAMDRLAMTLFPGYSAMLRNQLYSQWSESATDPARRQAALKQLLPMVGRVDPAQSRTVYAAALDMLAAESDPRARDTLVAQLQNVISPELMEAAIDALERTGAGAPGAEVRRTLISILGNGLRGIEGTMRASMQSSVARYPEAGAALAGLDAIAPTARTRLTSIAGTDPDKLNRMLASRALAGEDQWNQYVAESLKDTTLRDVERLEGFAYLGRATGTISMNNPLLDDAAVRSAGDLIIRAARDPAQVREAVSAVKVLAAVKGEAARDAGLKILKPGSGLSAASPVRAAMLVPLMTTMGGDPVVREVVEDLARSDADPLMRRRAAQVLQVADDLAKERRPMYMLPISSLIEGAPSL
jgi:hypothetical protein